MVSSKESLKSFNKAADEYNGKCTGCGKEFEKGGPCAHHTSDAMVRGGFTDVLTKVVGGPIKFRCTADRPGRAKELRDWVAGQGYTEHASRPPPGTAAFFYAQNDKDGSGHVGLIDKNGKCRDTGVTDLWGTWRKYYW